MFYNYQVIWQSVLLDFINMKFLKEVEVKDVDTDTVVGINIVSRCTECGKINSTFVSSDSRFLDREYVYINNKK